MPTVTSHFQLVRGTDSAFSRIQAPLWVEAKEATKILFLIFSSAVDFSDKHENVVNTDISQCYGSDMQRERAG